MPETNELLEYQTAGVCCQLMRINIIDEKLSNVEFFGGCNGNLKGIANLVKGLPIDDVIEKLQGITCGSKSTSCPDQLAKCLIEYKNKNLAPSQK